MYATDAMARMRRSTMGCWTEALRRTRSEYAEVPGLRLTLVQAQRLLGVAPLQCGLVLGWLVDEGFLRLTKRFYVKK
jgi:hypothetical protein